MSKENKGFTDEELAHIAKLLAEAYEKAGEKKLQTITLHNTDNDRVLVDNREDEDIN